VSHVFADAPSIEVLLGGGIIHFDTGMGRVAGFVHMDAVVRYRSWRAPRRSRNGRLVSIFERSGGREG